MFWALAAGFGAGIVVGRVICAGALEGRVVGRRIAVSREEGLKRGCDGF